MKGKSFLVILLLAYTLIVFNYFLYVKPNRRKLPFGLWFSSYIKTGKFRL